MENPKRCLSCMKPLPEQEKVCPYCHYTVGRPNPAGYLAAETVLSDHYLVGRALGSYGDACIYVGYDQLLKSPVFIREFFPAELAQRLNTGAVRPTAGNEERFDDCRRSFYDNVRALAKLKELPGLLPLYDIFDANDTAYAVYDYCDGRSLSRTLKGRGGRMAWAEARPLFMQLMTTVSTLHRAGVCHLAISPDTLLIDEEGKLRLRSFAIPEARTTGSPLKPRLSAGFSAPEQYAAGAACDAATDVYGLAATMFYVLTGTVPPAAPRRVRGSQDLFLPAEVAEQLPESVGLALFNALQPDRGTRLATVEDFRAALSSEPAVNALLHDQEHEQEEKEAPVKKNRYPLYIGISVFAVLAILAGIALALLFPGRQPVADDSSDWMPPPTTAPTTAPTYADPSEVYAIPKLLGLNYYSVKNESMTGDFKLAVTYMKYDEKKPKGTILSQQPEPGTSSEAGSTIQVVISMGSENLTVPDVAGWPQEYATKYLEALGFRVEVLTVNVSKYEKGLVEGTDPSTATALGVGDTVTIRVSNMEPSPDDTSDDSDDSNDGM